MNDKFDELAKALAQPLARRAALKRFGVALGAFALVAVGLASSADAAPGSADHAVAAKGAGRLPGLGEPCNLSQGCRGKLVCRIVGLRAVCTQRNGIG
jgi:hypothetical protein